MRAQCGGRRFIHTNFPLAREAYGGGGTSGISDDVSENSSAVLGDFDETRIGEIGLPDVDLCVGVDIRRQTP